MYYGGKIKMNNKKYSISEIIVGIMSTLLPMLIIFNFLLEFIPWNNYRYGMVVGAWNAWFWTRKYYQNKK